MDEPGFEPGSFGTEVWNARQWPNYWTNRLLDELGFEPGSFGTEVWNARQWPNLFYIKMYKFGDLNLNNSKIGGSSWKPKLSAISPFRDGSPSIIGFEEDPPILELESLESLFPMLNHHISWNKASTTYHKIAKFCQNSIKISKIVDYYSIWGPKF